VVNKTVKFAEKLGLETDGADVEELLDAYGTELRNEELMELEAAENKEQENAEAGDEPVEEPWHFISKEMVTAFRETSSAMARCEKVEPNSS
jgi:hypothetical protein